MTTDITELAQSLKAAAEKASNGDWVKESGDGWEACCSANDQANGGFIIAHFEGPDAAENREFVQVANPANILALVEALEKAQGMEAYWKTQCRGITDHCEQLQAQIAELESRTVTVKLPEGDERDDLVISITEEIAHLQRCVERYKKEEMASTTQEMEQRLLVQQIALSVLNSAAGIKWEAE